MPRLAKWRMSDVPSGRTDAHVRDTVAPGGFFDERGELSARAGHRFGSEPLPHENGGVGVARWLGRL